MASPRRVVEQLPPGLIGLEGPSVRSMAGVDTTDSPGGAPQVVAGAGQRRTAAALPLKGMEDSQNGLALQWHDQVCPRALRLPFPADPRFLLPMTSRSR